LPNFRVFMMASMQAIYARTIADTRWHNRISFITRVHK
jgi:hypothetical protein